MEDRKKILYTYLENKAKELNLKFPNITIMTDFIHNTFVGKLYTNKTIFVGRVEMDGSVTDITNEENEVNK